MVPEMVFASGERFVAAESRDPNRHHGVTATVTLPVDYQCRGEAYDNYTRNVLHPYAQIYDSGSGGDSDSNQRRRSSSWGRRAFPLPDHSSVMVLGNSHTKQVIFALLCQHSSSVRTVQLLGPKDDVHHNHPFPNNLALFLEARFVNGASLVLVGNHPIAYSREWAVSVQRLDPQRRSLSEYDAVVLGQFNAYDPKYRNTNFFTAMFDFQHRHPDFAIDIERVPGPTLPGLARAYRGPIIVLPMFSGFARAWADNATAEARRIRLGKGRSNIDVVKTRGHILATGAECGSSADRASIGTCIDNSGAHRCAGPNGGDADLMAWDLIEALYDAIQKKFMGV
jgi:hypothetical protein